MARFKTNLKTLMLKKSVELDRSLTRSEVAEATHLSLPTISRWYNDDIDRIEPNTLAALLAYFNCKFEDLIEIVE